MKYIDKYGKPHNTYVISNCRQDEMLERGYCIELVKSYSETEQELYDRLSTFYKVVRIYESTTRIAGLHDIYAMCKF